MGMELADVYQSVMITRGSYQTSCGSHTQRQFIEQGLAESREWRGRALWCPWSAGSISAVTGTSDMMTKMMGFGNAQPVPKKATKGFAKPTFSPVKINLECARQVVPKALLELHPESACISSMNHCALAAEALYIERKLQERGHPPPNTGGCSLTPEHTGDSTQRRLVNKSIIILVQFTDSIGASFQ
ncbi:hypothetical protein MG293_020416, partial [Ovis ammon polii]